MVKQYYFSLFFFEFIMNCLYNGLSIMVKTNLKVADFLDVHFQSMQDIYQSHKKPNDDPSYINKNSNHFPVVIKQIPKAISK